MKQDIIVKLPLVITKKQENKKIEYYGFIPGLTQNDVVCVNIDECERKLKDTAVELVKKIIKNNANLPYFPDENEIKQDFEDIALLKYIRIHL